jgi:hypothetical protein
MNRTLLKVKSVTMAVLLSQPAWAQTLSSYTVYNIHAQSAAQPAAADPVVVKNSIIAIAHVLHHWSGVRGFANLAVALNEEVKRTGTTEPLLEAAQHMVALGATIHADTLYREGLSVLQGLDPASASAASDQYQYPQSSGGLAPTTFEQLSQNTPLKTIFASKVFSGFVKTAAGSKHLNIVVHTNSDYIADAIYMPVFHGTGAAGAMKVNAELQQIRTRFSESAYGLPGHCGYGYLGHMLTMGAGVYAAVAVGMGPFNVVPGVSKWVGVGAFATGMVLSAVYDYDEYKTCKKKDEEVNSSESEAGSVNESENNSDSTSSSQSSNSNVSSSDSSSQNSASDDSSSSDSSSHKSPSSESPKTHDSGDKDDSTDDDLLSDEGGDVSQYGDMDSGGLSGLAQLYQMHRQHLIEITDQREQYDGSTTQLGQLASGQSGRGDPSQNSGNDFGSPFADAVNLQKPVQWTDPVNPAMSQMQRK